jgi:hypothetical protein
MEQSPSWEADSHSAIHDIPLPFIESEASLPCSQDRVAGPYPEPDASNLLL